MSTTAGWLELADQILDGHPLSRDQGLAIVRADDSQLIEILAAAHRVRASHFGNRVHLNFLINAKSGVCGEDCGYCSQSRVSQAEIPRYNILRTDEILDGARLAAESRAGTYCIVLSGRKPSAEDLATISRVVPEVKRRFDLKICVSPGLLDEDQAALLRQAGVNRVNHNLNTSRRFYPKICSTHDYDARLQTLGFVRDCGMEICSGGIVGMGEEDEDVVDLALQLGRFSVEAVPVNFLKPIPGTPLENVRRLNPRYCLKCLALFRFANPTGVLRMAAGREEHLATLQPLGLFAANSIFIGDYLTTKGQPPEDDYRMLRDLGFEIVPEPLPQDHVAHD